jgi:hypothetical protein
MEEIVRVACILGLSSVFLLEFVCITVHYL